MYSPYVPRIGPGGVLVDGAATVRGAPGSRGIDVKIIQDLLNFHNAQPPLKDDGIYGPKTTAAVRAFQSVNGLVVDGIVGPQTSAKLNDSEAKDIGSASPGTPGTSSKAGFFAKLLDNMKRNWPIWLAGAAAGGLALKARKKHKGKTT